MSLVAIDRRYIDQAWPFVVDMLKPAVECNHGEATLEQVRSQIAYGDASLLVWQEDQTPTGAAVVEFVQHPNMRVAHISYIGGRSIVRQDVFNQVKEWCRSQGASEVRALCDEAHARLFGRTGFTEIYRLVKVTL